MQVRSLAPLSTLGSSQLSELYMACNKIAAIESLDNFPNLRTLELGGNRIRVVEGALPSVLACQLSTGSG
jgi:Leucine-rich repeat (LRR) protein